MFANTFPRCDCFLNMVLYLVEFGDYFRTQKSAGWQKRDRVHQGASMRCGFQGNYFCTGRSKKELGGEKKEGCRPNPCYSALEQSLYFLNLFTIATGPCYKCK
ncbi:hypothetical protein ACF0H5_015036 [Mactra antiquata]